MREYGLRLADEIAQNTVAAACWDHRFTPVQPDELDDIELTIDIIIESQDVAWPAEWDVSIYGIQVHQNNRIIATLLPALEHINNAQEQFTAAIAKANTSTLQQLSIQRFTTHRYPNGTLLPLSPYESAVIDTTNQRILDALSENQG